MVTNFPNGRSVCSSEIEIDESRLPSAFSLVWQRQSRLRELPRVFWGSVASLFVFVGLFAIEDLAAKLFFVMIGLYCLVLINTKLKVTVYGGTRLERVTTLGKICIGVEIKSLPQHCSFKICKMPSNEGRFSYLVAFQDDFIVEVLPVEPWDDYSDVCKKLNHAIGICYSYTPDSSAG